jgi:hypothetical protein
MCYSYTLTLMYKGKQHFRTGKFDGAVYHTGINILKGLKKLLTSHPYEKIIEFFEKLNPTNDDTTTRLFREDEIGAWYRFKYEANEVSLDYLLKEYPRMGWSEESIKDLEEMENCNYFIDFEAKTIKYIYHDYNYYKRKDLEYNYTFDQIDDLLKVWEKGRQL